MKYVVSIILACLLGIGSVYAGEPDFARVDSVMLNIPARQTGTSGAIASYVKANFPTETDRVRAIYVWIAENISYDMEDTGETTPWGAPENIISYTLSNRKGVCDNFSALFSELCGKVGIESYTIAGYVKEEEITGDLPHSWNAAKIDGTWYMFDVTWGAGYGEEGVFNKQLNDSFFMVDPQAMILTHMPFDTIWQFLEHPVTYDEFGSDVPPAERPYPFNYADSIKRYEKRSPVGKLADEERRIIGNGTLNVIVQRRLDHIDHSLKYYRRRQHIELYESAKDYYNRGTANLEELIRYRKANPLKIVNTSQPILDSASKNMDSASAELKKIRDPDSDIAEGIATLRKHIARSRTKIDDMQAWINRNK